MPKPIYEKIHSQQFMQEHTIQVIRKVVYMRLPGRKLYSVTSVFAMNGTNLESLNEAVDKKIEILMEEGGKYRSNKPRE